MTYKVIAYDYIGVPRCWGEGDTADIAETRCLEIVAEYRTRRPDLFRQGFTFKTVEDAGE